MRRIVFGILLAFLMLSVVESFAHKHNFQKQEHKSVETTSKNHKTTQPETKATTTTASTTMPKLSSSSTADINKAKEEEKKAEKEAGQSAQILNISAMILIALISSLFYF